MERTLRLVCTWPELAGSRRVKGGQSTPDSQSQRFDLPRRNLWKERRGWLFHSEGRREASARQIKVERERSGAAKDMNNIPAGGVSVFNIPAVRHPDARQACTLAVHLMHTAFVFQLHEMIRLDRGELYF